jgi:hypothetical protein
MMKLTILLLLSLFFSSLNAQLFCDKDLGYGWSTKAFLNEDSITTDILNNLDTIIFHTDVSEYPKGSLNFDCMNSTFSPLFIDTMYLERSQEIVVVATESDENNINWTYDSATNLVSLKIINFDIWHYYKLEESSTEIKLIRITKSE